MLINTCQEERLLHAADRHDQKQCSIAIEMNKIKKCCPLIVLMRECAAYSVSSIFIVVVIGLLRSIQFVNSYHSFHYYLLYIYNKYHHSPITTDHPQVIHPPCTFYNPELVLLPSHFKFIPDFLYIFSSAIFVLPSSPMKPIKSVLHSNSGLPTGQP